MAISNLSAYGGLQRDCLSIARRIVAAGHDVTILTTEVRGAIADPGCPIRVVETDRRTNPGRDVALGAALRAPRREFDRVVGFNKLPLLDIYYSGDRSYAKVKQGAWRPFSPRYRAQMQLEHKCFAPDAPHQPDHAERAPAKRVPERLENAGQPVPAHFAQPRSG